MMFFGLFLILEYLQPLQFYFQNGRPLANELKERSLFGINQFFYDHMDGLQVHGEMWI